MTTPDTAPVTEVPGAATSADSVDAMAQALADEKIRATLSNWEEQLAATLAKAAEQSTSLAAQVADLTRQLQSVRAQAGPPEAVTLAKSLATRVANIAIANPDLSATHFAGVVDQAARLAEAAQAAAGGKGPVSEVQTLATAVHTWFTRAHPRISTKILEGSHVALDEVERIIEGLPQLAPAAAQIISAV